jgi:hypothetical protein
MIKAVMDANVYVSALLSPASKPGRILELAGRGILKFMVSIPILEELERVLCYPKIMKRVHLEESQVKRYIKGSADFALITSGDLQVADVSSDPCDNKYLTCAIEGGADYIVSGDRHLTEVRSYQEIPIFSPAEFIGSCQL